jgi:hypothetical protein
MEALLVLTLASPAIAAVAACTLFGAVRNRHSKVASRLLAGALWLVFLAPGAYSGLLFMGYGAIPGGPLRLLSHPLVVFLSLYWSLLSVPIWATGLAIVVLGPQPN